MASDMAVRAAEAIKALGGGKCWQEANTLANYILIDLPPVLAAKDAEIAELRSERDALAAQVAELKKLLRPFANYANAIDKYENYENHVAIGYISGGPNVGDCRAARAALQEPSRDE